MTADARMTLALVVERRDVDSPWQDHAWRPLAVVPGGVELAPWRELRRGEGWAQFHAGNMTLELHKG